MSIDTYGLSTEQYEEFFEDNVRFAAKLYLATCNILTVQGVGNVDFKTVLDMFQECTYQTNDDCRRYQKANNPEAVKDDVLFELSPSRQELKEKVEALDAKVDKILKALGTDQTVVE